MGCFFWARIGSGSLFCSYILLLYYKHLTASLTLLSATPAGWRGKRKGKRKRQGNKSEEMEEEEEEEKEKEGEEEKDDEEGVGREDRDMAEKSRMMDSMCRQAEEEEGPG